MTLKILAIISLTVFLASCGDDSTLKLVQGEAGVAGSNGKDGADGKNGADGQDGTNGENGSNGAKGDKGDKGDKGNTGNAGANGTNGTNGTNGIGCSVTTVTPSALVPNGGALVVCASGSVLLVNGAPGLNGTPAPVSPYQIDAIIDPCGDKPGITDEIMIKLHNGMLLSSVSDSVSGTNTRLSSLAPSTSWITTDGSFCYVNVDASLNVTSHY